MDEADLKLQKASEELISDFTNALPKLTRHTRVKIEKVNSLVKLLEPFQEWPQLVDPHLSSIVSRLAGAFLSFLDEITKQRSSDTIVVGVIPVWRAICMLLYTLCKVRGYKVIIRFFNNEPKYLEPMLAAYNALTNKQISPQSSETANVSSSSWEERYIVLLWLSHLMLTPFDLSSMSSERRESQLIALSGEPKLPDEIAWIANQCIRLSIYHLAEPSKEREAAALLLVRVALRPDMQQYALLQNLLQWTLSLLEGHSYGGVFSGKSAIYVPIGLLSFLAGVIMSADTAMVAPYLGDVFKATLTISSEGSESTSRFAFSALTRKLIIKTLRSVVVHLQSPSLTQIPDAATVQYSKEEMVEEVIDYLLNSLADKDTPVRYAASKALSMIAAQLEPAMAADIVEAVVGSLEENVLWDDISTGETIPNFDSEMLNSRLIRRNLSAVDALRWHGLVLTLSQLLFRRSAPPNQLPDVLNALILALGFEQRSTTGNSVGTSVRDAACFGIWAIARRYTTEELQAVDASTIKAGSNVENPTSLLQVLANELICAATLDSAGNIRRGASAALQELIGRHPDTIEQGISVVQAVDYHAVALRSRAMIEVSLAVSSLSPLYWRAAFDGLLTWRGVGSPDTQSRRDAATAIGLLSEGGLQTVLKRVRQTLRSTKKSNIEECQALLLSMAAIIQKFDQPQSMEQAQHLPITNEGVGNIFDDLSLNQKHFASPALRPTLTAEAVSSLIKAVARVARVSSTMDSILKQDLLKRTEELQWCLKHKESLIIHTASEAIYELFFAMDEEISTSAIRKWIMSLEVTSSSRIRNYGASMALAMAYRHRRICDRQQANQIKCALLAQTEGTDIDAKIWALKSLTSSLLAAEDPDAVTIEALLRCLKDHATDQRGDVGSLVRLEATRGVAAVVKRGIHFPLSDLKRLISKVCGLAVEKLDKVRLQASHCLNELPAAVMMNSVTLHCTQDSSSSDYFRHFLSLSTIPEFCRDILEDLAVTASSGSESLLVASRAALAAHAEEIMPSQLDELCCTLVDMIKSNVADDKVSVNDRLLIPAMDALGFLFEIGVMERLIFVEKYISLTCLVKSAHHKSLNIRKLEAAIQIYSGILITPNLIHLHSDTLLQLTSMLLHQYPKIRNAAADTLFLEYPDCSLIRSVNWTEREDVKREDIKTIRAQIEEITAPRAGNSRGRLFTA